jgi:hypothetical protein
MGGQDGSSRDLLSYNEESSSLMAGFHFKAGQRWDFNLYGVYVQSEAALDPFDLPADDYVAITPPMNYDFSIAHTYTDIDLTRFEGGVEAKYNFTDTLWARAKYHLIDYQDDAPFLEDFTGRVDFLYAMIGFAF